MTPPEPSHAAEMPSPVRAPTRRGFVKRDARRQRTQQDLRAAGLRLFADGGYATCSIEDIAREAGATRSTFYLHYDSKQALLTDIVVSDLIWQERRYAALKASGVPAKAKLLRWFESFVIGFRDGHKSLIVSRLAQAIDPQVLKYIAAKRLDYATALARQVPALRIFDNAGKLDPARRSRLYLLMHEIEQIALLVAQGDPAVDAHAAFGDLADRFRQFMADSPTWRVKEDRPASALLVGPKARPR